MKRRELISLLGGAAAWPLAAQAQLTERVRRIGVLMPFAEDDPDTKVRLAGFRHELERLGWLEGRNVRIDYRFAPAGVQAPMFVKELLALQPDVIVAVSTPITTALQRETRTVPIVFVGITADPISSGFVASLARPGGNLTGVVMFEETVTGKWLAMLKEIAPLLTRAALVFNPKTAPYYDYYLRAGRPRLRRSRSSLCLSPSRTPRPTLSAPSRHLRACRTAAWSCCQTLPATSIAICSSGLLPSIACPQSTRTVYTS